MQCFIVRLPDTVCWDGNVTEYQNGQKQFCSSLLLSTNIHLTVYKHSPCQTEKYECSTETQQLTFRQLYGAFSGNAQNNLEIILVVNQFNFLFLRQYFVQTLSHHHGCLAEISSVPGCLHLSLNSKLKWQKRPRRKRNCTVIMGKGGRKSCSGRKESSLLEKKKMCNWSCSYFLVIFTSECIWNFYTGDKSEKILKQLKVI